MPWTKPQDLVHDLKKPLPRFGGPKGEDFLALLCTGTDGKQGPIVHTVPADTDEKTLRCLIQWDNTRPLLPPWQK